MSSSGICPSLSNWAEVFTIFVDEILTTVGSTFFTTGAKPVFVASNVPNTIYVAEPGINSVGVVNLNGQPAVVADLPVIFQPLSLMTLTNSDRVFLVSTSELPSLHLARKAIRLLEQLGFPRDRFQMLVNRTDKRAQIGGSDIEKLFNCPVQWRLPNDFFSVNRAMAEGQAIDSQCELGKAIEGLAARLSGKNAEPSSKQPHQNPAPSRHKSELTN